MILLLQIENTLHYGGKEKKLIKIHQIYLMLQIETSASRDGDENLTNEHEIKNWILIKPRPEHNIYQSIGYFFAFAHLAHRFMHIYHRYCLCKRKIEISWFSRSP